MQPDPSPADTDAPVVLLRADTFDREMVKRGYRTRVAQAEAIGCSRSHLYDLINGEAEPRPPYSRRIVHITRQRPARLFRWADA